jgi:hypothetical protein
VGARHSKLLCSSCKQLKDKLFLLNTVNNNNNLIIKKGFNSGGAVCPEGRKEEKQN